MTKMNPAVATKEKIDPTICGVPPRERTTEETGPRLEEVHPGDHRAVEQDLDHEGHEERRLLHGAAQPCANPEDLEPADCDAEHEAVDGTNDCTQSRIVEDGEVEHDAVAGADQRGGVDHIGK